MVYNSQKGRGINDLFGTLNRAFTPVLESVADVGANVATGLVSDSSVSLPEPHRK